MQLEFDVDRHYGTEYFVSDQPDYHELLLHWLLNRPRESRPAIVLFSDTTVMRLYGEHLADRLTRAGYRLVKLTIPDGEKFKDWGTLSTLLERMIENHIQRSDLMICLGGGVCCDLGGFMAMLFMRGLQYINIPTTLMAQIDAAVGGKVGCNVGPRKNILGGFHHPSLVLVVPELLRTLPRLEIQRGLAEAAKIAIIEADDELFGILSEAKDLTTQAHKLNRMIECCIKGKIRLLADDPFEINLNRTLNLGHAVAHALEGATWNGKNGPFLHHGEAVSIGIATVTRYALEMGICEYEHGRRILQLLKTIGLPLTADSGLYKEFSLLLKLTPEHRGGVFRLAIPSGSSGVSVIQNVDIELLTKCAFRQLDIGVSERMAAGANP